MQPVVSETESVNLEEWGRRLEERMGWIWKEEGEMMAENGDRWSEKETSEKRGCGGLS